MSLHLLITLRQRRDHATIASRTSDSCRSKPPSSIRSSRIDRLPSSLSSSTPSTPQFLKLCQAPPSFSSPSARCRYGMGHRYFLWRSSSRRQRAARVLASLVLTGSYDGRLSSDLVPRVSRSFGDELGPVGAAGELVEGWAEFETAAAG